LENVHAFSCIICMNWMFLCESLRRYLWREHCGDRVWWFRKKFFRCLCMVRCMFVRVYQFWYTFLRVQKISTESIPEWRVFGREQTKVYQLVYFSKRSGRSFSSCFLVLFLRRFPPKEQQRIKAGRSFWKSIPTLVYSVWPLFLKDLLLMRVGSYVQGGAQRWSFCDGTFPAADAQNADEWRGRSTSFLHPLRLFNNQTSLYHSCKRRYIEGLKENGILWVIFH